MSFYAHACTQAHLNAMGVEANAHSRGTTRGAKSFPLSSLGKTESDVQRLLEACLLFY